MTSKIFRKTYSQKKSTNKEYLKGSVILIYSGLARSVIYLPIHVLAVILPFVFSLRSQIIK